jgi:hypothetical protein
LQRRIKGGELKIILLKAITLDEAEYAAERLYATAPTPDHRHAGRCIAGPGSLM